MNDLTLTADSFRRAWRDVMAGKTYTISELWKEIPMQGKRVDAHDDPLLAPGEYGIMSNGTWHGCTPNGHGCSLAKHTVIEHEDGTITVSPSILVSDARGEVELWHGYLERGVWREV